MCNHCRSLKLVFILWLLSSISSIKLYLRAVLTWVCEWFFASWLQMNQHGSPLTHPSWNQSGPNSHSENCWLIEWLCFRLYAECALLLIFVILLWWIDVYFCLLDDDFSWQSWIDILMSTCLCLMLLLLCYDFTLLWLKEPNQWPGWQCRFFWQKEFVRLLQYSETLVNFSLPHPSESLYRLNLVLTTFFKSNLCLCSFCLSVVI